MQNHFKIIVPFYNVEKWIKICVRSVRAQSYKNFQCILMDDMSTDNSVEVIKKEIEGDERFVLIQNTDKAYALKNIYDGINISEPKPEDIIVTLDGDDWLSGKDILRSLNDVYIARDCWLTYGSYAEYPSGIRGKFAKKINPAFITAENLREKEWMSSHLRTFKYDLWSRIKPEDLKDSEGNFYRMTWDLAFMYPMLEMAGTRSQYIEDIMYIYNMSNPLNDHKVDNSYQRKLELEIRAKEPYKRIDIVGVPGASLYRSNRFDIGAKTLYARHKYLGKRTNKFSKELYLQHLKVWNNFHEKSPAKNNPEDFLKHFDNLIASFREEGFKDSPENRIPVVGGDYAINGAHRIACSTCLTPHTAAASASVRWNSRAYYYLQTRDADISEGQVNCTSEYFRNKKDFVSEGLEEVYLDAMAMEYVSYHPDSKIVTIFPSATITAQGAIDILSKHGCAVVYHKSIDLSDLGAFNYIMNLYMGEPWIGSVDNGFAGILEKQAGCFSNNKNTTILLVDEASNETLRLAKEEIREVCGVGNHSIHINDTFDETWRIATSVFNKNSIHYLNNSRFFKLKSPMSTFANQFYKFVDWSGGNLGIAEVDVGFNIRDDTCIDASSVLSAYGLREGRDLDFLKCGDHVETGDPEVNCHNIDSEHYDEAINDIIYDPRNHFYFFGFKFASLDVIRRMKKNRNEPKDQVDVMLIDEVLDGRGH